MRKKNKYTILFVSDGTKRVKTIRITPGGLIITAVLCAIIAAGIIGCAARGTAVRKEYEKRIEVLSEENTRLKTELNELKEE